MTAPPTKEQVKAAVDRAEARSRGQSATEVLEDALEEGEAKTEIERCAKLSAIKYDQERPRRACQSARLAYRQSLRGEAPAQETGKSGKADTGI